MSREIERKFLVRDDSWRAAADAGKRYRQGYLCADPQRVVRVRVGGDAAYVTIKGSLRGLARDEYEYPIPVADAEAMLDGLCLHPLIKKVRHHVRHAGYMWEVDVFAADNAGLVVAEVELPAEDTEVELPPWVGAEVTHDPRYSNAALVGRPYSTWR